uniref:Complexin-2 n=1 Tax=Zonotrichia albicollis TaxID=44394 RepID=A0A8D2MWG0_ZONAL
MDFVMKQALGGATKDMGKMLGGEEEKDPDAQKKEEERQEALRQQEEERKAKHARMEAEREKVRQAQPPAGSGCRGAAAAPAPRAAPRPCPAPPAAAGPVGPCGGGSGTRLGPGGETVPGPAPLSRVLRRLEPCTSLLPQLLLRPAARWALPSPGEGSRFGPGEESGFKFSAKRVRCFDVLRQTFFFPRTNRL